MNIKKPSEPAVSLNINREDEKNARIMVNKRKTGRLERDKNEHMKARSVKKNPSSVTCMILRKGRGRSIIMVALSVMSIINLVPSPKPVN